MKLRRTSLGQSIDHAIRQACEMWAREHVPGKELEVALTANLTHIHASLEIKPQGRAQIAIEMQAVRHAKDDLYFFAFERRGFGNWVETNPYPKTKR